MKRLTIYFFYDDHGIVDDYIPHFLKAFKPYGGEIWIVVNEHLSDEGRKKLEQVSDRIIMRENAGLDAGAYKHALEEYGYDNLKNLDEVILTNFTCYGPMYPFAEMFDTMAKRKCDFWGLARHPGLDEKTGDITIHVQSYFVVYRKTLLSSPAFKEYWENLPHIESYYDSVVLHELKQTPFFASKGFTFDSYIDIEKYMHTTRWNSIIWNAKQQLVEDRSPLLKRRVFYIENGAPLVPGFIDTCKAVKKYTRYNMNLIYDNVVRTQSVEALPRKPGKGFKYYKYKVLQKLLPWRKEHYRNKVARYESGFTYDDFQKAFGK